MKKQEKKTPHCSSKTLLLRVFLIVIIYSEANRAVAKQLSLLAIV
jgi:hypothetical protein